MNREEAKEILTHNWTRIDNPNYSESELDEAFFMAIEALSSDTVQGFRGGKIPPKEMLDGTVLIPQHQWLEMERELANLKEEFESAVPNCQKCAIKELWKATEKEDLVAVVRCKDCRHIYKNDFCSFYGCPTEADGYCNNGERRK